MTETYDFPLQGGSTGIWGTGYFNFFKRLFHMSGTFGGNFAIVCNEGHVVVNANRVVSNIDRSL